MASFALAVASSPAAATVLCKAAEEPCAASQMYPASTALKATASEVTIKEGPWTWTCKESVLSGETLAEGGAPLQVALTGLTFSGCKASEVGECGWTVQNLPYYGGVEKSGSDKASVTVEGGAKGNPTVTRPPCFMPCTYGAASVALVLEGGNPAHLTATEQSLTRTNGFLCPASISLSAKYTISAPNPAHVALNPPAVICKVAPDKDSKCPAGQIFTGKFTGSLPGSSEVTLMAVAAPPAGTVTCTEAPMSGEIKADGTAVIESFKFSKGGGDCSSNFPGSPKVATSLESMPDKSWFSFFSPNPAESQATFFQEGKKNLKFKLVPEGGKTECVFRLTGAEFRVTNPVAGQPMHVVYQNWVGVRIAGNTDVCPGGIIAKGDWWFETAGSENIWAAKN